MGSFQTALSALKAASTAINAVGNNLANINTVGFKRSDVTFEDIMNTVGGSGTSQTGGGVGRVFTTRSFTQGNIANTGNSLDAAVQGGGFFVVRPPSTGAATAAQYLYTRDGSFTVSNDGFLATADGNRVQGWGVNATTGKVDTTGASGDISIPLGSTVPPVATSSFSISANLDASAAGGTAFTVPVQIFDSLGGSHQLSLTFTKDTTAANTWNLSLSSADPAIDSTKLTAALSVKTLKFTNGVLDPATAATVDISAIPYTTASGLPAGPKVSWSLFTTPPSGTPPTGGVSPLTQFSQASALSNFSQNGSAAGILSDVHIANGGQLIATYSNGVQSQVGQIALAGVSNPDTLVGVGGNLFRAGADSNVLPPGMPQAGGAGQIVGEATESSNVDIATEFTNLITFQRGYEASSRVITTIDQLTQETINLKQ